MKIYALLLSVSLCYAPEDNAVHNGKSPGINNVVTLNINTSPVAQKRPGAKHPAVIAAHEKLRRQQSEEDAITCCCFIKLKKKI